jgi:hypothetical protein
MNARFTNDQGKEQPIIMGCYGLGVSRTLMAVVEQHTYENGLVWPKELRPYTYHILLADVTNEVQMQAAETLYQSLSERSSVLIDDRNERLGSKFQDADLIGSPVVIVIGKLIKEGLIEIYHRELNSKSVIKNNIVFASSATRLTWVSNDAGLSPTFDNNIYWAGSGANTKYHYKGTNYSFTNWKTQVSGDANSDEADPLYIDAANDDFRIQTASPAKDAGTDVGLTHDYDGVKIPKGAGFDIGAIEYLSTGTFQVGVGVGTITMGSGGSATIGADQ